MSGSSLFSPHGRFADWRLALQSIIGFWSFYLVTVLLRGLFGPEAASAIGFRGFIASLGLVLTILIYAAIRWFAREGSIRRMAIVAAVAALPASVLMSYTSLWLTIRAEPMGEQSKITTQEGIAIVQRGQNVRIIKQG